MTAADKAKPSGFDATRAKATPRRGRQFAIDLAELDKALSGTPARPKISISRGDWRCRVLKLGKGLPIVVYPGFDCRAFETITACGWKDRRLAAHVRLFLLRRRSETDDLSRRADLAAMPRCSTEAGRGARPGRLCGYGCPEIDSGLEFPQPEYESLMDVMEFERVGCVIPAQAESGPIRRRVISRIYECFSVA